MSTLTDVSSPGLPPLNAPAGPAPPAPAVDKSGEKIAEMFRQVAPRYDRMNHLLSLNIDRLWRRKVTRMLPAVEDLVQRRVLDACTGTGDLAIAMRRRYGDAVEVIGSDFCPAMLDLAREKDGGSIEFLEADTQKLPFPDDHFGAVTVAFGLRNVADTDAGLREMTRVLAPGGRLFVLEFSHPRAFGLRHAYGVYFRHVLPRVGQALAANDKDAYRYLHDSVDDFPDYERLSAKMDSAGLVRTGYTPLTFGVATVYTGVKPAAENSGAMA